MTHPTRNPLKAALHDGRTLQGCWSLSGSTTVVEALCHTGPDYIVLDLEHSPSSVHEVRGLLQAADAARIPAAVRMPDHDSTAIKQVLDLGAVSLLFPFVDTAPQAAAIVAACLYPPAGHRGFSRMNRAGAYLADADYPVRANDDIMIVAQLETETALANIDGIATTPGISGVFLGPGDLSMALGIPGQLAHPRVRQHMSECAAAARRLGISCGTVMPDVEQAMWAFDQGYHYVSVSNDLASMVNAARDQQRTLRERRGTGQL